MMEDPRTIARGLALTLIVRSLERIGDQATNIAEQVIYLVEGEDVRHRHAEEEDD
jgi:phosphate transport system protein